MENPEIRYLGDVQRLDIKPGDVFILTLEDHHVSPEIIDRLKTIWYENVGRQNKLVVLTGGMKLGAIRAEDAVD